VGGGQHHRSQKLLAIAIDGDLDVFVVGCSKSDSYPPRVVEDLTLFQRLARRRAEAVDELP
jgi:hypothetical protein